MAPTPEIPCTSQGAELRFAVHVLPGAKRTQAGGVREGALLVRVAPPAEKGAANDALLGALAEAFGVRRSDLRLVSGERSRRKVVAIEGVTPEALSAKLAELARPR